MGTDPKQRLDLKEDKEGHVSVRGLTQTVVKDAFTIHELMREGNKNRTTGSTLMNADSSRSHSIFMVSVDTSETADAQTGRQRIRAGKLNLVDLAGSERQSKTGAVGTRLKEATKINLSLSALGNVISALVAGAGKHVPYRDSKLTRLLQDSLGGNTRTIMIAAVSPADYNYEETLSTLRYANRAKNITNKPKINEDPKVFLFFFLFFFHFFFVFFLFGCCLRIKAGRTANTLLMSYCAVFLPCLYMRACVRERECVYVCNA